MYEIQMGPVTYVKRGGQPFTLAEAVRETYGVGQAKIRRLDGTVVVDRAGSLSAVVHAPTGRVIRRRPTIRR